MKTIHKFYSKYFSVSGTFEYFQMFPPRTWWLLELQLDWLFIIVESVKLNMEYFRIIGDIFSRSSWVQGLESGVGCELMGGEGGKWNQQGWPWTRRLPRAHAGYARIRRKIGMEESSNHWERGRKDTKREGERVGYWQKGRRVATLSIFPGIMEHLQFASFPAPHCIRSFHLNRNTSCWIHFK